MEKIAKIYALPAQSDYQTNSGSLTVRGRFNIVNIFGKSRRRTLSLGRLWDVGLDQARNMVSDCRKANAQTPLATEMEVVASFTIVL